MIAYHTLLTNKAGEVANSQCKSAFSYLLSAYPDTRILAEPRCHPCFSLPPGKKLNCAVNGARAGGSVGRCCLRRLHVHMCLLYPLEPNMTTSPWGVCRLTASIYTTHLLEVCTNSALLTPQHLPNGETTAT
jgi:hypothetical protein